ncbi:MAG: PIN domain-containing protein [Chloroflexota bacterium]
MPVVVDTSAVIAMYNRGDRWHEATVRTLSRERSAVYVPQSVVTESGLRASASWTSDRVAMLIRGITSSAWRTECLTDEDLERTAEILDAYRDSRIDLVDASVVAVAERLRATRIYTLDRRDFSIVRPRHIGAFELLP